MGYSEGSWVHFVVQIFTLHWLTFDACIYQPTSVRTPDPLLPASPSTGRNPPQPGRSSPDDYGNAGWRDGTKLTDGPSPHPSPEPRESYTAQVHVHNFGEREANNHSRRNDQIFASEVERIRLRYEELARIRLHYKELTREGVLRRQEAEEMAGENTGEIKRQEEVVRRKARKMAKGARKQQEVTGELQEAAMQFEEEAKRRKEEGRKLKEAKRKKTQQKVEDFTLDSTRASERLIRNERCGLSSAVKHENWRPNANLKDEAAGTRRSLTRRGSTAGQRSIHSLAAELILEWPDGGEYDNVPRKDAPDKDQCRSFRPATEPNGHRGELPVPGSSLLRGVITRNTPIVTCDTH